MTNDSMYAHVKMWTQHFYKDDLRLVITQAPKQEKYLLLSEHPTGILKDMWTK